MALIIPTRSERLARVIEDAGLRLGEDSIKVLRTLFREDMPLTTKQLVAATGVDRKKLGVYLPRLVAGNYVQKVSRGTWQLSPMLGSHHS